MEYRIVIDNNTRDGETPVSTNAATGKNPDEGVPVDQQKKSDDKSGVFSKVMVATNVVKPYVSQVVSFSVSNIEMETGSAALQRKAQAFSGLAGSATSIVTAGIMGGPAAAAAAAGTMMLQKLIQTEINRIAIQYQKQIEQENISLQRSRLGLSANRSRGGGVV